LKEFKEDITEVIERAKQQGVKKFYLPAIDSKVLDDMLLLEDNFQGECIAMIGLHPSSVNQNYKKELQLVEEWLNKRKFAAIGEIGLDFYWSTEHTNQQYEAFELQMQWALQNVMPIVIHSRNAMDQTIKTVKPFSEKGLTGIFHCFSGTAEEARQVIELGFYVGIGGVLTYKNAGLAQVIESVPIECIVLETDAPYLSPVPFRGKRNESSYLIKVAEKLAEVKKLTIGEVAEITTRNAEKIFAY
jgi:TatD DNase family protein